MKIIKITGTVPNCHMGDRINWILKDNTDTYNTISRSTTIGDTESIDIYVTPYAKSTTATEGIIFSSRTIAMTNESQVSIKVTKSSEYKSENLYVVSSPNGFDVTVYNDTDIVTINNTIDNTSGVVIIGCGDIQKSIYVTSKSSSSSSGSTTVPTLWFDFSNETKLSDGTYSYDWTVTYENWVFAPGKQHFTVHYNLIYENEYIYNDGTHSGFMPECETVDGEIVVHPYISKFTSKNRIVGYDASRFYYTVDDYKDVNDKLNFRMSLDGNTVDSTEKIITNIRIGLTGANGLNEARGYGIKEVSVNFPGNNLKFTKYSTESTDVFIYNSEATVDEVTATSNHTYQITGTFENGEKFDLTYNYVVGYDNDYTYSSLVNTLNEFYHSYGSFDLYTYIVSNYQEKNGLAFRICDGDITTMDGDVTKNYEPSIGFHRISWDGYNYSYPQKSSTKEVQTSMKAYVYKTENEIPSSGDYSGAEVTLSRFMSYYSDDATFSGDYPLGVELYEYDDLASTLYNGHYAYILKDSTGYMNKNIVRKLEFTDKMYGIGYFDINEDTIPSGKTKWYNSVISVTRSMDTMPYAFTGRNDEDLFNFFYEHTNLYDASGNIIDKSSYNLEMSDKDGDWSNTGEIISGDGKLKIVTNNYTGADKIVTTDTNGVRTITYYDGKVVYKNMSFYIKLTARYDAYPFTFKLDDDTPDYTSYANDTCELSMDSITVNAGETSTGILSATKK